MGDGSRLCPIPSTPACTRNRRLELALVDAPRLRWTPQSELGQSPTHTGTCPPSDSRQGKVFSNRTRELAPLGRCPTALMAHSRKKSSRARFEHLGASADVNKPISSRP